MKLLRNLPISISIRSLQIKKNVMLINVFLLKKKVKIVISKLTKDPKQKSKMEPIVIKENKNIKHEKNFC
jgi:hypothetical protein